NGVLERQRLSLRLDRDWGDVLPLHGDWKCERYDKSGDAHRMTRSERRHSVWKNRTRVLRTFSMEYVHTAFAYSYLRHTIGSAFAALRAGMIPNTRPTATDTPKATSTDTPDTIVVICAAR